MIIDYFHFNAGAIRLGMVYKISAELIVYE